MKQRIAHADQSQDFIDREDAGRRLAKLVESYRDARPLILGIPRGGVPVAAEVARHLDAELDVVVARKLGAPGHAELAIGAATANGGLFLDEETIDALDVSPQYLEMVIARERAEAKRREVYFRRAQPRAPIAGRTIIIVDDGLATGSTMRAAVRSVRKSHPARIVVAVPVGSHETCQTLRTEADDVVCLQQPEPFFAVGVHYARFDPTEDEEARRLLQEAANRRRVAHPRAS